MAGWAQVSDGWAQMTDGWAQMTDGWAQMTDGWANAHSGPPLATPLVPSSVWCISVPTVMYCCQE